MLIIIFFWLIGSIVFDELKKMRRQLTPAQEKRNEYMGNIIGYGIAIYIFLYAFANSPHLF